MKFLQWNALFILWTVTILFLTWYPKVEIPDIGINAEDKIAHIGVFCVWGILLLRTLCKYEIKRLRFAVKVLLVSGVIFAIMDESVQAFIPGRYFTLYDMLANIVGVLVSIPVFQYIVVPLVRRFSRVQD